MDVAIFPFVPSGRAPRLDLQEKTTIMKTPFIMYTRKCMKRGKPCRGNPGHLLEPGIVLAHKSAMTCIGVGAFVLPTNATGRYTAHMRPDKVSTAGESD